MKKKILLILFLQSFSLFAAKIGLLVVATNKYIRFIDPLLDSADKYFCPGHKVTYFVFTDKYVTPRNNLVVTHQEHRVWPYATLLRSQTYLENKHLFDDMDYLFACDADMLFLSPVGDEILAERVATQHPYFLAQRGTYETSNKSTAYIAPHEGSCYFAGGFYGGTRDVFMHMMKTVVARTKQDLDRGIIAVWHDESQHNRYYVDYPPTKILSPSYCYPEGQDPKKWHIESHIPKLLALDKNHEEMRS